VRHDVLYRDIKVGEEVLDILLPPRVFVGENLDYFTQKVIISFGNLFVCNL